MEEKSLGCFNKVPILALNNTILLRSVGTRYLMNDAFGCHKLLKLMRYIFCIITMETMDKYIKLSFYFIIIFFKDEK